MDRAPWEREHLYRELLAERFGTVRELQRERPPTPWEITQRRLVLLGQRLGEADYILPELAPQ